MAKAPSKDVIQFLSGTSPAEREELIQRIKELPESQLADFTRALRHETLRRCAEDGRRWRTVVRTLY